MTQDHKPERLLREEGLGNRREPAEESEEREEEEQLEEEEEDEEDEDVDEEDDADRNGDDDYGMDVEVAEPVPAVTPAGGRSTSARANAGVHEEVAGTIIAEEDEDGCDDDDDDVPLLDSLGIQARSPGTPAGVRKGRGSSSKASSKTKRRKEERPSSAVKKDGREKKKKKLAKKSLKASRAASASSAPAQKVPGSAKRMQKKELELLQARLIEQVNASAAAASNAEEETAQHAQRFRFTSFPVFPTIHIKNVSGTFRRDDRSHLVSPATRLAAVPKPEKEGDDIIVIHPGSRYLRIGLASDTYPKTIPHVFARLKRGIAAAGPRTTQKPVGETLMSRTPQQQPLQPEASKPATPPPWPSAVSADTVGTAQMDVDTPQRIPQGAEVAVTEDDDLAESMEEEYAGLQAGGSDVHAITAVQKYLKRRWRSSKRRGVANAHFQLTSYNAAVVPEQIMDHNDPYRVEWTDATKEWKSYYVGLKALRLSPSSLLYYDVRWPMQNGMISIVQGVSMESVLGDLDHLWTQAIKEELGIDRSRFKELNATLIIPDIFDKRLVVELISMLHQMGFRGVLVHQESICTTMGAGASLGCVVDIGAQKTSIACVEDGLICPESKVFQPYGGDDVTFLFMKQLGIVDFPYREIDLNRDLDWMLAQELKERFCTADEPQATAQVHDFFVRVPEKLTRKYTMKFYEEPSIAPLCLFYPGAIDQSRRPHPKIPSTDEELVMFRQAPTSQLQASSTPQHPARVTPGPEAIDNGSLRPPTSNSSEEGGVGAASQPSRRSRTLTPGPAVERVSTPQSERGGCRETSEGVELSQLTGAGENAGGDNSCPDYPLGGLGLLPLDHAILTSILGGAAGQDERAKRFLGTVILVGGGSTISGFSTLLEERMNANLPSWFGFSDAAQVIASPRDMDPSMVAWKGAAVYSRLESAKEMWLGPEEFELMQGRLLKERAVFTWS